MSNTPVIKNRIQILPVSLSNKIAAGEVVERPASVVKELIENSIDAEATKISLVLKKSGKELVQIVDNGCGMSQDDAKLALERQEMKILNLSRPLDFVVKHFPVSLLYPT